MMFIFNVSGPDSLYSSPSNIEPGFLLGLAKGKHVRFEVEEKRPCYCIHSLLLLGREV